MTSSPPNAEAGSSRAATPWKTISGMATITCFITIPRRRGNPTSSWPVSLTVSGRLLPRAHRSIPHEPGSSNPPDRAGTLSGRNCGALPFVTPDGNLSLHMEQRGHHVVPYAIFPPEKHGARYDVPVCGVCGDRFADYPAQLVQHGLPAASRLESSQPRQTLFGANRKGTEYFQNTIVWAVPAAIAGKNIRDACAPGSLVSRVMLAGKAGSG